ncbi:hypothetical protein BDN70DRAFT_921348 [Pholiota conissans]|uniref:SH3 domain-containing protein n=1 Tax=Pholiota conissans TaxID=109636 RepID=A0A9P5Z235_9AGAR|nr:hypothetical protein BDN70DRAFT_921348 [Pholiota conissans]
MPPGYQRSLPHAGRGLVYEGPIVEARDGYEDTGTEVDHDHVVLDNLSGPITVTIIQTLPIATSASSTQWTTMTSLSVVTSTSTQTSTTSTSTSTSTSTTSTTSSTLSTTSTAKPTSATSSTVDSSITQVPFVSVPTAAPLDGNKSEAQGKLSTSSSSLSGGAIAGIVISLLAIFAAVLIFFLRRWLIARRKRSTGEWTKRVSISPFTFGAPEPKLSPAPLPQNLRPLRLGQDIEKRNSLPKIAPPPLAVNSPTSSFGQPQPVGFDASAPSLATVICTFNVSLPDELSILVGEKLKVAARYDDGWAFCTKANGEQGMVPLECLEEGGFSNNNALALPTERGSRRVSSLISNGVGSRVAGN